MQFEEEYVAIQTVKESLEEAWTYFHSGKVLGSSPSRRDGGAEAEDGPLPPPTVGQAHELLDVYYQLLQTVQASADPHQRAFVVDASIQLRGGDGGAEGGEEGGEGPYPYPLAHGVLPVLANMAVHPMAYAPEVLDAGAPLAEAFGGLRAHALRCLKGIVLLAATAEDEAIAAQQQFEHSQHHHHHNHRNHHHPSESAAVPPGLGCASRCTAALIRLSLPEDLLVTVLPAASSAFSEAVRIAACEALFAFAFRLPSAVQSLLVVQAVPRLLLRLRAEPSPTVRVFICSILRLVVTEMPSEAIGDGTHQLAAAASAGSDPRFNNNNSITNNNNNNASAVANAPTATTVVAAFAELLLNESELDDVRVMAAEVLSSACKTAVGAAQLITRDNALLSDVLLLANFTISAPDAPPVVVEALCRLVEAMVIAASALRAVPFFELIVSMEMEKPLAQNLRRPTAEVHIAAAAARALRHLLQWSPPAYNVGHAIVTTFPTLSVLLKTILDCERGGGGSGASDANGTTPASAATAEEGGGGGEADLHQQVLAVEVALSIALLMAQSPFARSHLRAELGQYPSWAQSLLDAVAKFLNAPTLEYYAAVDIVDVGGFCINTLTSVQWSEGGKPLKSSVRRLFEEQAERVRAGVVVGNGGTQYPSTTASSPFLGGVNGNGNAKADVSHEEVRARARLTFVLLNFAMALALAEDGAAAPPSQPADNDPNNVSQSVLNATTPRGGAGGRSTLRTFPSMGPNSSRLITSSSSSAPAVRPALSRAEKEQLMFAYDKFDSAFKLVLHFSKYYDKKADREGGGAAGGGGSASGVYLPTADGYMVRQTQLKNPWAKIVKRRRALSWAVGDVKEGDMFYFAVPYDELSLRAVESLISALRRHMASTKKALVITPHAAKGRRSLLYDLQENVLPQTMDLLERLASLLDSRGEGTVRFPIFLFREREIHVGERCLHSGILPQIMGQVEYYFAQSEAEQRELQVRPELVADIDAQIAALRAQTFTGLEDPLIGPDSDDDERVPGRGHGGISSDSD